MNPTYPMNYRRYRQTGPLRDLFSTVDLDSRQLIQPYFIDESLKEPLELKGLYGQKKHTLDSLLRTLEGDFQQQVRSALLFIVPKEKSQKDFNFDFDAQVIGKVKEKFGRELVLFTDLCLCSNTHTGHCGLEGPHGSIDNDSSVKLLVKKALIHAQAGSDVISPSDMMDDRILAMRREFHQHNLHSTLLMSYSTKFSSQFYGPFREAADSAPAYGDRKTYQIDPRNLNDALRSSERDAQQGADILMVKPAGSYLDIIYRLKQGPVTGSLPLCAYQVSGEYQSLWLMHQAGYLSFPQAYWESLVALRRAGSDLIITYGASQFMQIRQQVMGRSVN